MYVYFHPYHVRKSLKKLSSKRFKQVIVVRSDLKMGRGKLAAQVAHAAVMAAEYARSFEEEMYRGWLSNGQAKVVVKVGSLGELLEVKRQAEERRLITAIVEDRGLTQLPSGTITCLAVGPGSSIVVDEVTGSLKLL